MKTPLVEIENVKRLSFGKESHLHGCHPRGKASTDIFQRSFIWERTRSQHIYHLSTHKIIPRDRPLGKSSQHIFLAPNKNLFDILKTMKSNNLKSNFSN